MAASANNITGGTIALWAILAIAICLWLYVGLINPIMRFSSKDKNANKGLAAVQMIVLFIIPVGAYVFYRMSRRNNTNF